MIKSGQPELTHADQGLSPETTEQIVRAAGRLLDNADSQLPDVAPGLRVQRSHDAETKMLELGIEGSNRKFIGNEASIGRTVAGLVTAENLPHDVHIGEQVSKDTNNKRVVLGKRKGLGSKDLIVEQIGGDTTVTMSTTRSPKLHARKRDRSPSDQEARDHTAATLIKARQTLRKASKS